MKLKPAFNLSRFTVAWNWGLSLFSAVGFAPVVTAFAASGAEHGFVGPDSVLCRRDVQFDNQWVALFCLSKIPELVDTALLVLQKKPVIFLHWYHHAVTLFYCWVAWVRSAAALPWPCADALEFSRRSSELSPTAPCSPS